MTFQDASTLRTRPAVVTTVDITLSDRALHLSTVAATIGGTIYEPVLKEVGDVDHSCDSVAGISKVSDFDFTAFNKKLGFQATGKVFGDAFTDYVFMNAAIELKEHLSGGTYTRSIFKGRIQSYDPGVSEIAFHVTADLSYDKSIPPTMFRKTDANMGRLPEAVQGTPIPIVIGDFWNTPWPDDESGILRDWDDPSKIEKVGIVRNVVPLILYDPMDATTHFQNYRACSHAAHTIDDADADEVFVWESSVGAFVSFADIVDSFVNSATAVDVKLKKTGNAVLRTKAFKKNTGSASWQQASDGTEYTSCTVGYGLTNALRLYLDPLADLGDIISMNIAVLVKVTTASDQPLYVGFGSTGTGTWEQIQDGSAMAAIEMYEGSGIGNWTWNLCDGSNNAIWIGVGFTTGTPTTGVVEVYEIALEITYRPNWRAGSKGTGKTERHMWTGR